MRNQRREVAVKMWMCCFRHSAALAHKGSSCSDARDTRVAERRVRVHVRAAMCRWRSSGKPVTCCLHSCMRTPSGPLEHQDVRHCSSEQRPHCPALCRSPYCQHERFVFARTCEKSYLQRGLVRKTCEETEAENLLVEQKKDWVRVCRADTDSRCQPSKAHC